MEMEGDQDSLIENFSVDDFIRTVLSWSSLDDLQNENLYETKVDTIPDRFNSVNHYLNDSFKYPLLEETRFAVSSAMKDIIKLPYAEVTDIIPLPETGQGFHRHHVRVNYWRNRLHDHGKGLYSTLPGDLLILVDAKPETVSDLIERTWSFASVAWMTNCVGDRNLTTTSLRFNVIATKGIEKAKGVFAIFLQNLTTQKRIWNSLLMSNNPNILEKLLCPDPPVHKENLDCRWFDTLGPNLFRDLDDSQVKAVRACLLKIMQNQSGVELIWGPPGTGKTKITSRLVFALLTLKKRCLICAATNVAVREVASQVLQLLRCSPLSHLGDIILFGSKERLDIDPTLEDIYVDCRAEKVESCIAQWQHHMTSLIDFFTHAEIEYQEQHRLQLFVEKKSFREYFRERLKSITMHLESCLSALYTHISTTYLPDSHFRAITSLLKTYDDDLNAASLDVEETLRSKMGEWRDTLFSVCDSRGEIDILNPFYKRPIKAFCLESASLIFCTVSSAFKLHHLKKMQPVDVLVIDEAANLKECESLIPLQLPQISHLILVGDECQLPPTVQSKICIEAGFGRSLFQRLSSLGHSKYLLNTQYRMHPEISSFPNRTFYQGRICNAPNVLLGSYSRSYLTSRMFGPYAFLNVPGGREESEVGGTSWRNPLEVTVVLEILDKLYKAWSDSEKEMLSIGVISPYANQVGAIRSRLPQNYQNEAGGFVVKVQTVGSSQGREMDIIIISSVRSNAERSIGFLSDPNRTNVALTRARYCMWILGNEMTLRGRPSVWSSLVCDARARGLVFDADDDKDICNAIIEHQQEEEERSREGYLEASKDWDADPSLDLSIADGTSFAENTEMSESLDMEEIQQEFLERTIHFYHEKGDRDNMMLYVNFMKSDEARRDLLERLECLDELLCMEKKSGNFVEAARVAKLKGDLLDQSMMLVQAKNYKDASLSILEYVLFNSVWGGGCEQKDDLLSKARLYGMFAQVDEPSFPKYVNTESAILAIGSASKLNEVQDLLRDSRAVGSLRGEILCTRALLDMHLKLKTNLSKFSYEDYLVCDLKEYTEEKFSTNKVFVETLVYSWDLWREKILHVIKSLDFAHESEPNNNVQFSLSYLGVLKHYNTCSGPMYTLLNPNADWARRVGSGKDGLRVQQLIFAAKRYWGLELVKIGMEVVQILNGIDKLLCSSNLPKSEFYHGKLLTQIFEVASSIMESKFVRIPTDEKRLLGDIIQDSSLLYFDYMFPLDWRKCLQDEMILLRHLPVSSRILRKHVTLALSYKASYKVVGRVAAIFFGFKKRVLRLELYPSAGASFFANYQKWHFTILNLYYMAFPENLRDEHRTIIQERGPLVIQVFAQALYNTFMAKRKKISDDYMSPAHFMYLLERLVVMTCFSCCECIVATKSGFIEWLADSHQETLLPRLQKEEVAAINECITQMVMELLKNPKDMLDWIRMSGITKPDEYRSLMVLKLFLLLCAYCSSFSESWDLIADLLPKVKNLLPGGFSKTLKKGLVHFRKGNLKLLAKAFKEVNDPLMIIFMHSGARHAIEWGEDAIVVDMTEPGADKRDILLNLLQLTEQARERWKELEEKEKDELLDLEKEDVRS